MNCSKCVAPLPEIGEIYEETKVRRLCSCGTIHETQFAKPTESKLGHVATIRYGKDLVRVPIIGEWHDRFKRRYLYVAIWDEAEKRFLSYRYESEEHPENSILIQSISAKPMQLTNKQKAMSRAIGYMKRMNKWHKLASYYLPYEDANRRVVVAFNVAGQASFRDEFDYDFNEGDVKKRAKAIVKRDYYAGLYRVALAEAELV